MVFEFIFASPTSARTNSGKWTVCLISNTEIPTKLVVSYKLHFGFSRSPWRESHLLSASHRITFTLFLTKWMCSLGKSFIFDFFLLKEGENKNDKGSGFGEKDAFKIRILSIVFTSHGYGCPIRTVGTHYGHIVHTLCTMCGLPIQRLLLGWLVHFESRPLIKSN